MKSPKRQKIAIYNQTVKKLRRNLILFFQESNKLLKLQESILILEPIEYNYIIKNSLLIYAQVIIVHGFGEHSENYKQLTDCFLLNNFKVHLYDQRGFGFSGGIRTKATIEQMHMDLQTVLDQIDKSVPLFIFCHALGAAIVIGFYLMNPQFEIQGLIFSNSQFRVPPRYGKMKIITLQMMSKDLQVNMYHNLSFASKNNHHIRKLATDRLIHPYMSIKFALNVLLFQQQIIQNSIFS